MEFSHDNLKVEFIAPMTEFCKLDGRKYTFTHNDETGALYLDVFNCYNYKKVNFNLRDEVLGEWILAGKEKYNLCFYVYLKGSQGYEIKKKYEIFKKHLEFVISSILYGDRLFLQKNNFLLSSPITVRFFSHYFMFNSCEYYGLVNDYMKKEALTK